MVAGIAQAVDDKLRNPSVITISHAALELAVDPNAITAIEQSLADAVGLQITVCAASGDWGSSGTVPSLDDRAHLCYPASSSLALACGGTCLVADDDGTAIVSEVVWNANVHGVNLATGGGISEVFEVPAWQAAAGLPPASANEDARAGRGVPDVAGRVGPVETVVQGKFGLDLGTSAVAPLWAGLVACVNQALGITAGCLIRFCTTSTRRQPSATHSATS